MKTKANIKNYIIISSIVLTIVLSIVLIIVFYKKYDSFSILSIKKEYNYVLNDKEDMLSIPLFFENKKSFLTSIDQVESISIYNDTKKVKAFLKEIEKTNEIMYKDKKYYEFVFKISFSSLDDMDKPLYLNDAIFEIKYKNHDTMTYEIGNLNLFIKNDKKQEGIYITSLSAVTNYIKGVETIVGVNLRLYNNSGNAINIESIKLYNKHYDFDYLNYETELLDTKIVLGQRSGYKYETLLIEEGNMDLCVNNEDTISLFVPLKYINGIYFIDRLPLFINYRCGDNKNMYIVDDFQFFTNDLIIGNNGIVDYEYRYY